MASTPDPEQDSPTFSPVSASTLRTWGSLLLDGVRYVAAVGAFVLVVWEAGFRLTEAQQASLLFASRVLIFATAIAYGLRIMLGGVQTSYLLRRWAEAAVYVGGVVGLTVVYMAAGGAWPTSGTWLHTIHLNLVRVVLLLMALIAAGRQVTHLTRLRVRPYAMLMGLFVILIGIGTLLLWLPRATVGDGTLPLIDALFTATSAVCVTGLVVVPTGPTFTALGEGVVLGLIQLGGIGVISLATAIAALFGGGEPLSTRAVLKDIQNTRTLGEVQSLLRQIVLVTFSIEAIGAVLIFITAAPIGFESLGDRVYYSVFHAISAFCNAGFSTRPGSLAIEGAATNWGLNLTFIGLIILGGAGFIVLRETGRHIYQYVGPSTTVRHGRYTVQARLVWITSGVLIVAGAVVIYGLEYGGASSTTAPGAAPSETVLAALFQSVTTRTAGFATVDISALGVATSFFIILLMFIGASPGSTGGGIKTTTFALFVLYVRGLFRGHRRIDVLGRSVAQGTLQQAFLVLIYALTCVSVSTFVLLITETAPPLDLLFEATSAFATVGLSRGITADLTVAGKSVLIANMFLGRVGVLALVVFVARQAHEKSYRYPETNVMVA